MPNEIGVGIGVTSDITYIYLSGSDGSKLFKFNKSGSLIESINLKEGSIIGAVIWTGSHFWATSEWDLTKWLPDGNLAGQIYPAAEGKIGIA